MTIPSRSTHPSLLRAAALAAALAVAAPALAHHGWGSYDSANPVTISGPVAALRFENPHVHAEIVSAGKRWELTFAPPSRMNSRGAVEALLKPQTAIVAYGYPSRVSPNEMRAEWIEIAGKRFELR